MHKFFLILILTLSVNSLFSKEKPRVFIFTDINIDAGDPDDRQSLVHLFWYANELAIEGIVPERWNARSIEACMLALKAYSVDFEKYGFQSKGYPDPEELEKCIAVNDNEAVNLFRQAAEKEDSPLYVLIWGNMLAFNNALFANLHLTKNIRIITIGTGLMLEKDNPHLPASWEKADSPCLQGNWNGFGRNELFHNDELKNLWWLEINWTYNGMFTGEGPREMFGKLSAFGRLGAHIKEVVRNEAWAQYFRVGDTPSVLYLIDPRKNLDNPEISSWAGKFTKPFPDTRPNYFTDYCGDAGWDYSNPCSTWQNHEKVAAISAKTLEEMRAEMYKALLEKLAEIYSQGK